MGDLSDRKLIATNTQNLRLLFIPESHAVPQLPEFLLKISFIRWVKSIDQRHISWSGIRMKKPAFSGVSIRRASLMP